PTANLSVSGTGFTTTTMLHDVVNPGNFFANIPATTPALLPGVPALVSIVNTLDPATVAAHTHPLVDVVSISTANFNPSTGILTVKATSSDTAPMPTLNIPTLATALLPAGPALDATGLLNVTGIAVPPASITVASAKGGSVTAPVTIGALPLPVAVADTATTVAGATALVAG